LIATVELQDAMPYAMVCSVRPWMIHLAVAVLGHGLHFLSSSPPQFFHRLLIIIATDDTMFTWRSGACQIFLARTATAVQRYFPSPLLSIIALIQYYAAS